MVLPLPHNETNTSLQIWSDSKEVVQQVQVAVLESHQCHAHTSHSLPSLRLRWSSVQQCVLQTGYHCPMNHTNHVHHQLIYSLIVSILCYACGVWVWANEWSIQVYLWSVGLDWLKGILKKPVACEAYHLRYFPSVL